MFNPMNDPVIDIDAISVGVEAAFQDVELAMGKSPTRGYGLEGFIDTMKSAAMRLFEMIQKFLARVRDFFFGKDGQAKDDVKKRIRFTVAQLNSINSGLRALADYVKELDRDSGSMDKETLEDYRQFCNSHWDALVSAAPAVVKSALNDIGTVRPTTKAINAAVAKFNSSARAIMVDMGRTTIDSDMVSTKINHRELAQAIKGLSAAILRDSRDMEHDAAMAIVQAWDYGKCNWDTFFGKYPEYRDEFYRKVTPAMDKYQEQLEFVEKYEKAMEGHANGIYELTSEEETLMKLIDDIKAAANKKTTECRTLTELTTRLLGAIGVVTELLGDGTKHVDEMMRIQGTLESVMMTYENESKDLERKLKEDFDHDTFEANAGKLNFSALYLRVGHARYRQNAVLFRSWAKYTLVAIGIYKDYGRIEESVVWFMNQYATSSKLRAWFDGIVISQQKLITLVIDHGRAKR